MNLPPCKIALRVSDPKVDWPVNDHSKIKSFFRLLSGTVRLLRKVALIDIISAMFVSHTYENERSLTYDLNFLNNCIFELCNNLQMLNKVLSNQSQILCLQYTKNFAAKCQHLDTSNIHYGGSSELSIYAEKVLGCSVWKVTDSHSE